MLVAGPSSTPEPLEEVVERALIGGVGAVQVRAPGLGAAELLDLARSLARPVRDAEALLLINDRIDVAMECECDGVHLKRSSLGPARARRLLGPDAVIGVSTHDVSEVARAFEEGADYVVFGPVFRTPSKDGILEPRGPAELARACAAARGPVLAIGGVDARRLPELRDTRMSGIAVVRAIFDAGDPREAAAALLAGLPPRRSPT